MATRARSGADLASTINANTSAPSNTIVVSSSGNITTANDLSLSGHLVGYVSNTYLQATFAQNTAIVGLANDRLQVANAAATYLTKSVALTSNNSLVNLINDREQVANAAVSYVTKAVHLTSNNALINLINDRYQPANLASDLVSYWPSANIINYVASAGGGTTMQTNTSIFIATGGETEVAIPYSNTNHLSVKLNGVRLTPDDDYTAANNTHIGNLLALTAADVLEVTEYKQHTANVLNRSAGGGGGGGSFYVGSSFGYATGGRSGPSSYSNVIDKYSFTSDGNASDVGDIVSSSQGHTGHSSTTDGYAAGGFSPAIPTYNYDDINKWPFSSDTNATDVASLPTGQRQGFSASSSTDAYISGGNRTTPPGVTAAISKFPFSSESTNTSVGDITVARSLGAGHSSDSNGYTAGGVDTTPFSATVDTIDKFPFSSDTNASDVGDMTADFKQMAGISGCTHGYVAGGFGPVPAGGPYLNVIEKFSFSADGNATDVGDLTESKSDTNGTSSTSNGYRHGGSFPRVNTIDKFPFSSDANATDVGDLTQARGSTSAQQV